MAITEPTAGGRVIEEGIGKVKVALNEAAVPGDLLGVDGSNQWVLADGNNSVYAELVAGEKGASGDTITAYRIARVGGYTAATVGVALYLKDTAGAVSESTGTVGQVVGLTLSATEVLLFPRYQFGGQLIPGAVKTFFRDSGLFIQSNADGKLTISADGSGTDDITLSGTITLDDDLITPTNKKIQFRDSGIYINSGADGKLTISADGSGTDDITLSGKVTLDDDVIAAADKVIDVTTADKLKSAGLIVHPKTLLNSQSLSAATTKVDEIMFIADRAYEVVSVKCRATVIENTANDATLMLEKVPSGTAVGSGSDILASAVNLKTGLTANTNATLALHATQANYQLAAGDALALDFGGTAITEFVGLVTVELKAI